MFKLTPLALLMALLLCGFGPGMGEEPEPEPAPEAEEDGAMDSSDMMLEMYENGTIKAMYWIQIHADPKAGQYWETEMDAYGSKMTTRWQVASVDGDHAVVECQNKMSSEYSKYDYLLIYKVNTKAKEGDANVVTAWAGKPGKEAKKIEIMEKPEPVADGGAEADPVKPVEEEFKDLEIAGKKWSGKLITVSGEGWESKVWMADNGWFGGMIKMQSGEMTTELKKVGEDAKPLVTLPKEEKEEGKKEEGKKEEGKKDDGKKGGSDN